MPGYPGLLAISIARALGASVICGGTDALGVIGESAGVGGNQFTLWGAEIGRMATPPAVSRAARSIVQGIVMLEPADRGAMPATIAMDRDEPFGIGLS